MQPFDGVQGRRAGGYTAFSNSEWADTSDDGGGFHNKKPAGSLSLNWDGSLSQWFYNLNLRQRKILVLTVATILAFLVMVLIIVVPAAVAQPKGSPVSQILPQSPAQPHPSPPHLPIPPPPPSHSLISAPPPLLPHPRLPLAVLPPQPETPGPPQLSDAVCSWSSFYLPKAAILPTLYDLNLTVYNSDWVPAEPNWKAVWRDIVIGEVGIHVNVQRSSSCVVIHATGMSITHVSYTSNNQEVQGGTWGVGHGDIIITRDS